MKRFFCAFAFLSLFTLCFAASEKTDKIDAAKEQLKHVNSYYWLSRAKNNDMIDLKKMLFHAESAQKILKDLAENVQVSQLKFQAENSISQAKTQIAEASESIGNFSPLFTPLAGTDSLLGRYEDPNEIAIKRCVESIVGLIKKPGSISQLYVVILTEGEDLAAEETAHEYINAKTSFYAIPRYELSVFLTKTEINALNHQPISKTIIEKICRQYSIKNVGVLSLFQNDRIDTLLYWGADYNYWNAGTGTKSYHCYADGFCESPQPYSWLLWLLILIGFPATLLFTWYNRKFNKDRKGSFAPIWLTPAAGALSFVVVTMAFKGVGAIDIDLNQSIISPMGIGWIAAFTLLLGLLPPLLAYIGASRMKQVSAILNNPGTVSSIVFGSFLGSFTFLAYTASVRLGLLPSLVMVLPAIVIILPVSLRLGIAYARHAISNDEASGIEYIILLAGLLIYMLFVLVWDFKLLLAASAGCLLFSVLAVIVPVGIVKVIVKVRKLMARSKKAEEGGGKATGLAWLRETIKEPQFFCEPWAKEFEKVQQWITENDDPEIEVVFIEAPTGCGKTRTANEIAKRIETQYREKQFRVKTLFGDCDEFSQEADVVSYEPFAQALSDLLGVGRFANPAEKADKLKTGLIGMGLKTAMRGTGLGALETLLDAGDAEQAVKTNAKEMANVVAEALTDLSRIKDGENGKVVFIIDDVQWMDNETFELLKLLFEALANFKDNQVSFIFTHRSDSAHGHEKVKTLIKELEKSRVINLNDDINKKLLENEELVKGILENLKFDFKTMQSFTGHFRGKGIRRPLHILQTIEIAIDMEMLEAFADRFVLAKDSNLKKLPPPDDFKRMVEELLSGLDPRIISVLQCCAVIGRSFRPSIVADIFDIDRLELLRLFKEPEERNIIRDVTEEDDVYDFVEKRTVGIFRGLKWTPREDESVSQMVREYHKRFVSLKERETGIETDKSAVNSVPYRDIISLASHSNAIKDVIPNKVVHYNRLAAERTYSRGMFSTAVNYYNNAIGIIEKDKAKVAPEIMLDLYISYAKCLLDEQSDSAKVSEFAAKAYEILKNPDLGKDLDKDWTEVEIGLIEALNYYRSRQFQDASIKSDEILKNDRASLIQKARAKFYFAASLPPQETERRRDMHLDVLAEIDKLLETGFSENDRVELLKVKSEAANNTGFVYLHGLNDPEQAIRYFETAIELNKMKEINDQKGIAISHTGLGDAYNKLNQASKAEEMYKVNLEISDKSGDLQGICMMNSKLGSIKIEEAKKSEGAACSNFCKEANKLYEASLATAEEQGDSKNICFALSGMIETITVSESYDQTDYVCAKLEKIAKKTQKAEKDVAKASAELDEKLARLAEAEAAATDEAMLLKLRNETFEAKKKKEKASLRFAKAPDFARNSLEKSLDGLAAKSPEHGDRVRVHCESL